MSLQPHPLTILPPTPPTPLLPRLHPLPTPLLLPVFADAATRHLFVQRLALLLQRRRQAAPRLEKEKPTHDCLATHNT
jgi:hypothetical protein